MDTRLKTGLVAALALAVTTLSLPALADGGRDRNDGYNQRYDSRDGRGHSEARRYDDRDGYRGGRGRYEARQYHGHRVYYGGYRDHRRPAHRYYRAPQRYQGHYYRPYDSYWDARWNHGDYWNEGGYLFYRDRNFVIQLGGW
ncbi:MAG: hypothetical protein IT483_01190 [Gammaproteobacteria bacterium]|nr:hypothetical protein [Gammaproteobacteria bacterium]